MLENLTAINLALLGLAMFTAGFVDAIAGGGGLIQTPAMLLSFPDRNPVEVVATSKTAAFFGTTTAAIKYRKSIKTDPRLLLAMVFPAFVGAAIGAHLASRISSESYKSSIFFIIESIQIAAPFLLVSESAVSNTSPVSYTHLTLPTKRIV